MRVKVFDPWFGPDRDVQVPEERMTRMTNARVAGFTFLFYIAVGITAMVLFGQATGGEGIAAKLASIAQHATKVRLTVLLTLLEGLSALVLAVTLYAITRDQDPDLAMLGLTCRVAEGITGIFVARTLGLLWLVCGVWLALWLLIKGVATPAGATPATR